MMGCDLEFRVEETLSLLSGFCHDIFIIAIGMKLRLRFILVQSSRVQSSMEDTAWQQEYEAAEYIIVRKQREKDGC